MKIPPKYNIPAINSNLIDACIVSENTRRTQAHKRGNHHEFILGIYLTVFRDLVEYCTRRENCI